MDALPAGLLLAALGAVAVAGVVHGTLGIGFPMVATPLIALTTDVRTAIILTLGPTLVVNVMSIARGGGWRESVGRYWPVAAAVLVGSVAGTRLLIAVEPAPFKLLLALLIFFYLGSGRIGASSWAWVRRRPRLAGLGFGCVGGLLAGTANVAVPVLIIYFSEMRLSPRALVQALNLCFLGGKLAQVGTFALAGALGWSVFLLALPLALAAALALLAGMALRSRVDERTYRRWLRSALFLIAWVLVGQFLAEA